MERFLQPQRLDADPNTAQASRTWKHWFRTFSAFLTVISEHNPDKLNVLVNYVAPSVYDYISECKAYEEAIETLTALYVKPKNEIFARYLLSSRKQQNGESLDEFLQVLKLLSADCNYKAVSAEKYREECIRDAFISGLQSQHIRQRLLENKTLDLLTAFDQARALHLAQKNSESYLALSDLHCAATDREQDGSPVARECEEYSSEIQAAAAREDKRCYFCGYKQHPRQRCPAREAECRRCKKKGHFAKVCKSASNTAVVSCPSLAVISAFSCASLSTSTVSISVDDHQLSALIDTGSSESFISEAIAQKLGFRVYPASGKVSMASSELTTHILGYCIVKISLKDRQYDAVRLSILPKLCSDVILGHDFLKQHCQVSINFGGLKPQLTICGLAILKVNPPSLFQNVSLDCVPIATRSRKYSLEDQKFIEAETQKLLTEGIIEPSTSPWRAQVVVTVNENHKKRMVIDYSQTINRYTQLDAYPLPRIDELVNKIAQYNHFTTIDLKSAYHQIPLREEDKVYTAFQANGGLYQFCRMPFGVTNGVACFQRVMNTIIEENDLQDTFSYLDDVTVCGKTKEDHDRNLQKFLETAAKFNLTLNYDKCVFGKTSINMLGYNIANGEIKPDPARLQPLKDLPIPSSPKSLRRVIGMFSHYSQWIRNFSDKIRPLVEDKVFPLNEKAQNAFQSLKEEVIQSVVSSIDDAVPFTVETDASDCAIAATLSQAGRPVAFFSRKLNNSEKKHSAVEKEAYAIVEAIRKWRHYLSGRHFSLITDQKSVSFIFNNKIGSKIKNDKIFRWRLELACYNFDIEYRPGMENITADTLSRAYCSSISANSLLDLHNALCHPGVTRMLHFVRSRNLPFSVDDIRKITSTCSVCCECKPRYHQTSSVPLIKATQPFERLSMDFKGPLPSSSRNRFLLTIIDEFSRFPFAYPVADISASTVIKCLTQLFSIFGMPGYVHSDRGASFMSKELKSFLTQHGVASSKTTPYNPQGNGQCERYNGVIWKSVTLALKSRKLPESQWETVLPDALHSIRSLLCTSTNNTPHERMFNFSRRSTSGQSLPSWLVTPGKVLMKKSVKESAYDPLVEEVELLECNPQYAHVRLANGRETTVSLRKLAPAGVSPQADIVEKAASDEIPELDSVTEASLTNRSFHMPESHERQDVSTLQDPPLLSDFQKPIVHRALQNPSLMTDSQKPTPRRSDRISNPPERLMYY